MPDPTLPDDELLRAARAYMAKLKDQPPPSHLEEDARGFVFSRRRRISLAALLGGSAVIVAGAAAAVIVLAFHHGPVAQVPATSAVPSVSAAVTPAPTATASLATNVPAPTLGPTAGWKRVGSSHLRVSLSYPPADVATTCRTTDATTFRPNGAGTDAFIEVGSMTGTCPSEGLDYQLFTFDPQATNPYCNTGSCAFDGFPIGTHGCFHTTRAQLDGVTGTRTFLHNTGPNCFPAETQGAFDVIYLFHTNGVYWDFDYHREAASVPDLTRTFDLVVSTVRFHA